MEKDFNTVRFLRFSANDPCECRFQDVVIDLVTDKLISGTISAGEENDDTWSVDVKNGFDTLPNPDCSIFAEVIDTGIYELLDENNNVIFKSEGYVPFLMNYYNCESCYDNFHGDYIELLIDDKKTGHLVHADKPKSIFNHKSDWVPVEHHPNLYEKGMNDAFNIILEILTSHDKFKISNAINVIKNFKNETEA